MATLEDIIPNKKALDSLYKLMILNNQNNYIVGEVLFVDDPSKRLNDGMYIGYTTGLLKYDGVGNFNRTEIIHCRDWEIQVCRDNTYEVLD